MPRSFTDDQLRTAVAAATSWGDVLEGLGKSRTGSVQTAKRHAERLRLPTDHFSERALRMNAAATQTVPFAGRDPAREGKGRLGVSTAIQWFLSHGYNVSLPIEPAVYDVVAESDEGLQRVQVKTAGTSRGKSGCYAAKLTRSIYTPGMKVNSRGRYRVVPYEEGTIDFFFIITKDGQNYLIPFDVVRGLASVVLSKKYAAYLLP